MAHSSRPAPVAGAAISNRRARRENVVEAPWLLKTRLRVQTFVFRVLNRDFTLLNEYRLIGEHGAKYLRAYLPAAELAKIDALDTGSNTYLHIKGLPTIGLFFPHPPDAAFRDRDPMALTAQLQPRLAHSEMLVAGVAHLLNAQIKRRYDKSHHGVGRDLRTAPDEPQVGDRDGSDMPLRFHQSTVELQLPVDDEPDRVGRESCRFKLYLCVKNRRRLPIYIIRVAEVVDRICPDDPARRKSIVEELKKPQFHKSGPTWNMPEGSDSGSGEILKEVQRADGERDWYMCFDPERVRAPDAASFEAKNAVRELREALIACRNSAIRIVPDRGDIIVVDNQRSLVSRREYYPTSGLDILRAALFRRPRWLRLYYAFRAPTTMLAPKRSKARLTEPDARSMTDADDRESLSSVH